MGVAQKRMMIMNLTDVINKIISSALLCDDTSYIVHYPGSSHIDANGVIRYNDPIAYQLAVEADKNGEDHFHAKRGDDGLLKKCDPQPYYRIGCKLTVDEYKMLREARSSYDDHDGSSL